MSGYESAIGSKRVQNQGMREFVVEDPRMDDMDDDEFEQQIRKAKQDRLLAKQGKDRLSPGAKKRIEMICGMTSIQKEVDIDGNIFTLRSLKTREVREGIVEAAKFDGTVELGFETRRQLLARSIEGVAGTSVEEFLGSNDLEVRLFLMDELGGALIDRLYREYVKLVDEVNEKYGLTTSQKIEEVVEEIKK